MKTYLKEEVANLIVEILAKYIKTIWSNGDANTIFKSCDNAKEITRYALQNLEYSQYEINAFIKDIDFFKKIMNVSKEN